jgi:hypothetical protein
MVTQPKEMPFLKKFAATAIVLAVFVANFAVSLDAAMSPSKKAKALEKVLYSPYVGKQQDWPTSTSALIDVAETKYGMPIYRSLPNKPYEIIGVIRATGNKALKQAAEAAQAAGADAILVAKHKTFVEAGIGIVPEIAYRTDKGGKIALLNGILIRWKR